MALEMKYFTLKPRSKHAGDMHAMASRFAMMTYASIIRPVDPKMARSLERWVSQENKKDADMELDTPPEDDTSVDELTDQTQEGNPEDGTRS